MGSRSFVFGKLPSIASATARTEGRGRRCSQAGSRPHAGGDRRVLARIGAEAAGSESSGDTAAGRGCVGDRISRRLPSYPTGSARRNVPRSRKRRRRAGAGDRPPISLHLPSPLAALRGPCAPGLHAFQARGWLRPTRGAARLFRPPLDSSRGVGPQGSQRARGGAAEPRNRMHPRRSTGVPANAGTPSTLGSHPRRSLRRAIAAQQCAAQGAVGAAGRSPVSVALAGKVALVTGGSRGIGRAAAMSLARAGADVVVTATREHGADDTARAITALKRRALAATCDVSDPRSVDALISRIHKGLGRIDV